MRKVSGNPDPNSTQGPGLKSGGTTQANSSRRPYSPPRVTSSEPLEATAGFCDGTNGVGKPGNSACNNPSVSGS